MTKSSSEQVPETSANRLLRMLCWSAVEELPKGFGRILDLLPQRDRLALCRAIVRLDDPGAVSSADRRSGAKLRASATAAIIYRLGGALVHAAASIVDALAPDVLEPLNAVLDAGEDPGDCVFHQLAKQMCPDADFNAALQRAVIETLAETDS